MDEQWNHIKYFKYSIPTLLPFAAAVAQGSAIEVCSLVIESI